MPVKFGVILTLFLSVSVSFVNAQGYHHHGIVVDTIIKKINQEFTVTVDGNDGTGHYWKMGKDGCVVSLISYVRESTTYDTEKPIPGRAHHEHYTFKTKMKGSCILKFVDYGPTRKPGEEKKYFIIVN